MSRILIHNASYLVCGLKNRYLRQKTKTWENQSGADPGFYVRGALLGEGSGDRLGPSGIRAAPGRGTGGGETPRKLLGIRKYRTSFLNRNWLKLYHVVPHRRYVQWSMIFYSWHKALLRLQYEEQQSKAFACSRKICVILFNAHYPISLRSKEKELIRMFEIVLWRGKWTCLIQNGKEQVKNIHNLTPMPVFTWSGTGQQRNCQSSHRRSWHGPPPFFLTFCLQIYFQ